MEALLEALMTWIGQETGRDVTNIDPPEVVEMTLPELTREYYADYPQLLPKDGRDERIQALYAATDGQNGTIYILEAQSVEYADQFENPHENPIWREVLLHELVHHIQWQNDEPATWACQRFGEEEAYTLGGRYLRRTHTDDPMPNRRFWARIYSRC